MSAFSDSPGGIAGNGDAGPPSRDRSRQRRGQQPEGAAAGDGGTETPGPATTEPQRLVDNDAAAPTPSVPRPPEVADRRHLLGLSSVRRIGRWAFPVHELTQDDDTLALLGRFGWFSIFLGFGQRIEFPDGDRWRIRSVGVAGAICPVVVDRSRRKVAIASVGAGSYGINGKDYACALYPAEPRRFGRGNRWILRRYEDELAVVTRNPPSVEALRPVPLGAVFLCLVLVRYGIPGESVPGMPSFRWG